MDETLSDKVYKNLLAILRGQSLAIGSQVSDKKLAEEMNVSRTPIRMALARLESEGLLEKSAGGGWTLAPIGLPDLEEIFLLKNTLSALLVKIVAQNITPEGITLLEKTTTSMLQASEANDKVAFGIAHDAYDDALFSLSGSKRLYQYLHQLENQWYRIKAWYDTAVGSIEDNLKDDLEQHSKEHQAIVQAITAGEADLASQLESAHVDKYAALVTTAVEKVLVPFFGETL